MLEDDNTKRPNPHQTGHHQGSPVPFLQRDMLSYGREATLELIVKSKSTTGVRLRISGGTRSSLISARHDAASNGALTTTTHPIDDFPIFLSVEDPSETNVQGDTFVSVSLRINKDVSLPLVSGFVYELKPLTYPANTMAEPMPNHGQIGVIFTSNPDTGNEQSFTLDDDEIWLVHFANTNLTTDTTVATRVIHLKFTPPNAFGLDLWNNIGQTASQSRNYHFAQFGGKLNNLQDNDISVMMPANLWLPPSSVITTQTTGLQAGDNFAAMSIVREKFYTGT